MDYGNIKKIRTIATSSYTLKEGQELRFNDTLDVSSKYFLAISPEINRFGTSGEYGSKLDYFESTDEEAEFDNALDCLFAATLFKGIQDKTKRTVTVRTTYDIKSWFTHWTFRNKMKPQSSLWKHFGISVDFVNLLTNRTGCIVPIQFCGCGIPTCFTRLAFILSNYHSLSISIPCILEGSGTPEWLIGDLELLMKEDKAKPAEYEPILPLKTGIPFLAPEMFYRVE